MLRAGASLLHLTQMAVFWWGLGAVLQDSLVRPHVTALGLQARCAQS